MKQKKGRGRPKKSSHELQTAYLDTRLTEAEKQTFKDAAELSGLPLSTWVRERLRRAAIRDLEEAGRPIPFLESPE